MSKKSAIIVNAAAAALGALVIAAELIWAKACAGNMQLVNGMTAPMRCTYTCQAGILIGFILLAVGIESLIRKQVSGLAYLAIGIVLCILPISGIGIGVCAKAGMACANTALWLRIIGIGACVCGVLSFSVKGDRDL